MLISSITTGFFLFIPSRRGYEAAILELKEISRIDERRQEGSGDCIPPHGGEHLIGYAPVESRQWSVAVTAPLSDFMGRINEIKTNSALVMLAFLGDRHFRDFNNRNRAFPSDQELVAYTRMVSSGNFGHQVNVTSKDEIGELAASFNEMTLKLNSSQEEIELEQ